MMLLLLLPELYKVYHNGHELTTDSSATEMFDHENVLEWVAKK
jgi:hypothetical protein